MSSDTCVVRYGIVFQVVHAAQYGGVDEASIQQQALQKMAEQDPAYFGERSASREPLSKTHTGRVRLARFLDAGHFVLGKEPPVDND